MIVSQLRGRHKVNEPQVFGVVQAAGIECVVSVPHHAHYSAHLHTTFELLVPLADGDGIRVAGTDYPLATGDLIIVAPNAVHERLAPS